MVIKSPSADVFVFKYPSLSPVLGKGDPTVIGCQNDANFTILRCRMGDFRSSPRGK